MHVIVEPSHTSIVLEVADLGLTRFIEGQYLKEYTSCMALHNVTGRQFDETERMGSLARVVKELQQNKKLI